MQLDLEDRTIISSWLSWHFVNYLTFININDVSVNNAIAFIELSAASGLTSSTILTYISAIKAKCAELDINGLCWIQHKVDLMVRSCSHTSTFNPPTKQVLSPLTLTQPVIQIAIIPYGAIYKSLFLLAFHGFFQASFSRHNRLFSHFVTSPDVSISSPGLSFLLKWTKTLQAIRDSVLSPLQPFRAPHFVLFRQ